MNAVTIVGIKYYLGTEAFRVNQILYGVKEPDNEEDSEAIKVLSESGIQLGYIANSIYSVAKGCKSAGRIVDTFEGQLKMRVLFIVKNAVIAEII